MNALPLLLAAMLMVPIAAAQSPDDVSMEIENATQAIQEMADAGFGTSYVNDTLDEARIMFSREEYNAASALAMRVWDTRDAAFDAHDLMDIVEEKMYVASRDFNVSEASAAFDEALALFRTENYLESKEKLDEAVGLIENMQSEAALEKSSRSSPGEAVMAAVYDNRYAVLAAAAMALAGLVFLRRHNRASAMRRRLAGMQDERASLQRLIAGLQEKYFVGSGIGKLDYDESMAKYVKRLTVLEKDIALLKENA